jgi:hypothetical protein
VTSPSSRTWNPHHAVSAAEAVAVTSGTHTALRPGVVITSPSLETRDQCVMEKMMEGRRLWFH